MALGCLDLDTDTAAAAATMLGLWLLLFTCLNVRPRSFYLVYSWHGASLHPSLHQDLAQLQPGVRTTIVYFYASHPDPDPLDGAGLQMIQTPFNYTLDSVYSARRRK